MVYRTTDWHIVREIWRTGRHQSNNVLSILQNLSNMRTIQSRKNASHSQTKLSVVSPRAMMELVDDVSSNDWKTGSVCQVRAKGDAAKTLTKLYLNLTYQESAAARASVNWKLRFMPSITYSPVRKSQSEKTMCCPLRFYADKTLYVLEKILTEGKEHCLKIAKNSNIY